MASLSQEVSRLRQELSTANRNMDSAQAEVGEEKFISRLQS